MNTVTLLIIAAIAVGGYKYYETRQPAQSAVQASQAQVASSGGFVALPAIEGQRANEVLVFAAENCAKEDAQRADRLVEDLSRNGLPARRTHDISVTLTSPDNAAIER